MLRKRRKKNAIAIYRDRDELHPTVTEDDNGNQPSKAVSRAPSRAPSRTPSRSHSRSRHRTSPPLEDRRDHSPKAPSHDPVRRDSPSRQHQPNYPGPTTQLAPVDSNPTTQPVESPLKSDLTQQPAQPHTDSTPTVSIHQLDLDNLKATTGFILKPNTTTDADQPPSSLTARIAPSLPVNLISSELTMELGLQVTDYDGDREDQGVGVRFNDGNLEYSLGKTTLRWRAGDAQSSEDGDKSTVVMLECEVFDRNGLGLVLGVDVVDEKKGS
ncbi:uncharacterized protein CTHT_0049550 [Thermochaetoides thermophila DSM 1495]|uniref:Uncharacterized protein n=1 Tax=Chaetomium thermophilum (strain DSM 1495 / CBS 144.50 / IMI 039719) TaxID=759272 RepID=G0SBA8_CHATD|nr:hypothetical protein CTHT_0049550 [Thermochaetoides thermophila DSM 1495]EGS19488.1 hypothetical protein CTHT_0049550 [Thermochaetoides thermophila DSM 1495]